MLIDSPTLRFNRIFAAIYFLFRLLRCCFKQPFQLGHNILIM